ncbi:MAG TPA: ABC transporter substrate binding protein [bacterium]|nr:ABC transporter substrate binding protein [bacterium]
MLFKRGISILLFFLLFTNEVTASIDVKRIFIIHSYEPSLSNVKDNNRGLFDALNGKDLYGVKNDLKIKYVYKTFYMDSKRKSDTLSLNKNAKLALKKIKKFKPDIIIAVDDNAALTVAKALKGSDIPIIICDINGDPVEYGLVDSYQRSGSNIVAIIERQNYRELIKFSKAIVKGLKKIIVLVDDSNTSKSEIKYFNQIVSKPNLEIKIISTGDWEEWKSIILENQDQKTTFFPLLFYTLKDKEGNVINQDVVIKWLLNNSKIAEFGGTSFQVKDGFLASVSTWSDIQGYLAGIEAKKVLNGERTQDLPVIIPEVSSIDINIERSKMLNIKLPFDILSSANTYSKAEALYR